MMDWLKNNSTLMGLVAISGICCLYAIELGSFPIHGNERSLGPNSQLYVGIWMVMCFGPVYAWSMAKLYKRYLKAFGHRFQNLPAKLCETTQIYIAWYYALVLFGGFFSAMGNILINGLKS
jgi:hypothetical protein